MFLLNRFSVFTIASLLLVTRCTDIPGLPTFPSLEQLMQGSPESLTQEFKVTDECQGTVSKIKTAYSANFSPTDCANLKDLLKVFMPGQEDNTNIDSDFMALEKVIVRSLSYDTDTTEVDISAAYTGTVPIIPDVLSVSNVNMQIKFTSGNSDRWRFDISGTITIGTVNIAVNIVRNDAGYVLTANSEDTVPLSDISSMFQTGDVLPDTGLNSELSSANLDSFSIAKPRLKAVLTDGYGFLFGGEIVISDWDPISANVLINKGNDGVSSVTIAVYTPSITMAKVFRDIFKMDISSVPVVGEAEVQNLAVIISTLEVNSPLTALDIGYKDMFNLPYQQGIKVQCDLSITDVTVSISVSVTPTEVTLSFSNPGELTLRKIVQQFLTSDEQSSAIAEENGETKLKNWPTFIEFDPLSIGLSKLEVEATKQQAWELQKFEINLFMAEPIILFDDIIRISDLKFEMSWTKGSDGGSPDITGVIQGSVTIGNREGVTSPKADIRIPFPLAKQEITFTFTHYSVHEIAGAFGFSIPDDELFSFLARIQLDKIALTFQDTGKLNKVSVDCSLPEMWPIYGSFSIGNMKLSISVDNIAGGDSPEHKRSTEKTWEFKITGHIMISTCDVLVSTALTGNTLTVEGTGTNCDVSIAQLLNSIGINPSSLPSMISGFTLSEPAAIFIMDRTNNKKSVGFGATTNLFGSSDVEVAFVSTGSTTAVVAGFAVQAVSDVPGLSFLDSLGLTSMIILYVSTPVTLDPYTWRKEIFNEHAPTSKELDAGLMMKARFEPSADDFMGKLLVNAGKTTIDVSLTFPGLVFSLDINLGDGLPLGSSGGKFVGMGFTISPSRIGLNLKFSLTMDNADLLFTGTFTLTFTGTVTISLLMEGNWNEPFGLNGFAIKRLGLELGINVATLLPAFGLTGEITVTPPGREPFNAGLTICVDTANLLRTVFEIHFSRLLLADIVNVFLNRDMGLPEKVGEMGFPSETNIFFSPAGGECFKKTYEPGIEIHGAFQIPFLGVFAQADIVVKLKPTFQLSADLRLSPINWADGLLKVVSAESDTEGPFLVMNIGNAAEFLIDGSCKVVIFGASISIRLTINKEKFYFRGEINLWGLFSCSLEVEIVYGTTSPSLRVIGEMKNDLFTKLRQRAVNGIRSGANAVNEKITSAQRKVSAASAEADKILNNKKWHLQQIENAKRECRNAPWYKAWYVCPATGVRIAYHYTVIGGIYAIYGTAKAVLAAANLFLEGVKGVIKVGAEIVAGLASIVLGAVDIKYMKFDLQLSATRKTFDFECRIVIMTRWTFNFQFSINFSSSQTAQAGINTAGDQVSSKTMKEVE